MTTPEWEDPFRRTPGSGGGSVGRTPVPRDAPPPSGPLHGGPPPGFAAPPSEATWRGASAAPPPDWNALQPWKRTWGVTFRRWGRGWAVGSVAAIIAGAAAPSSWLSNYRGYSSAETSGYFVGTMFGAVMMYMLFVAWWLDHVLAGSGANVVLAIHTLLTAGLGAMVALGNTGSGNPMVPVWYLGLFGLIVTPLAAMFAARVKGSFEASPQRAEDMPWGPGRA